MSFITTDKEAFEYFEKLLNSDRSLLMWHNVQPQDHEEGGFIKRWFYSLTPERRIYITSESQFSQRLLESRRNRLPDGSGSYSELPKHLEFLTSMENEERERKKKAESTEKKASK